MNVKQLRDALNQIDDALIADAEVYTPSKGQSGIKSFIYLLPAAASALLIISANSFSEKTDPVFNQAYNEVSSCTASDVTTISMTSVSSQSFVAGISSEKLTETGSVADIHTSTAVSQVYSSDTAVQQSVTPPSSEPQEQVTSECYETSSVAEQQTKTPEEITIQEICTVPATQPASVTIPQFVPDNYAVTTTSSYEEYLYANTSLLIDENGSNYIRYSIAADAATDEYKGTAYYYSGNNKFSLETFKVNGADEKFAKIIIINGIKYVYINYSYDVPDTLNEFLSDTGFLNYKSTSLTSVFGSDTEMIISLIFDTHKDVYFENYVLEECRYYAGFKLGYADYTFILKGYDDGIFSIEFADNREVKFKSLNAELLDNH